jgi:predicted transcriptional regulator
MQVLWTAGPSNVQAVQAGLKEELAYTTVQTMLNVLERKGHVKRRLVGRAYEYRPLQTREVAQGSAVSDLLNRLFDGSAEDLVMNMVRSKQVDGAKLAELARKISIAEEEAYADSE